MLPFETLVEQAWNAPFSGWNFGFLRGRYIDRQPSWDYLSLARQRLSTAAAALDMDTGGGELFSSLQPFPPDTCATEGYPPNVPIARDRLQPLGIEVVQTYEGKPLPLASQRFDLVLNRHGSYDPAEVLRVLRPGGLLLTQQVGGQNMMLVNAALQDQPAHPYAEWTLENARSGLLDAGFEILDSGEEFLPVEFMDIGALVYFLKVISWQIEGFTPDGYMEKLRRIDAQIRAEGSFRSYEHRFFLEARRPA